MIARAELEKRKQRMEEECAKQNQITTELNAWEFVINLQHNLTWCPVFKAASSSMMNIFNRLSGYSQRYLEVSGKTPIALLRRSYARPTVQKLIKALNKTVSFIIVRDPFERLISAFRDKMRPKNKYYSDIQREIIQKHRNDKNDVGESVRFPEFVDYLIDCDRNNVSFNEHWVPYSKFCTPCAAHFDLILKVETLEGDQEYLLKEMNLDVKNPPKVNISPGDRRRTDYLIQYYFRQLSEGQLNDLYKIYRQDFKLFNYNAEIYYNLLDKYKK